MLFKTKNDNFILKDIEFKNISIDDKSFFEEYLDKTTVDINLWGMNFAYTIAFDASNVRNVIYKIIDDMLCIFTLSKNNIYMLYPPIGKYDKKKFNIVIIKCMRIMLKINDNNIDKSVISTMTEKHKNLLYKDYFKFKKTVYGNEHIYNCKDVAELKGKEFEYIRRKINKFNRLYPNAIWRKCEDKDWNDLMVLKKLWKDTAGTKYFRIIDASYYMYTIKNREQTQHNVFVVELDKKVIGMISGSYLNKDKSLAWCFNRKPLNNYEGLSEFLINNLCKEFNEAKLLNDGGDGGPGGLRFFKQRFRSFESTIYACTIKKEKLR